MAVFTCVFVLLVCIIDGHPQTNDFYRRWCSPPSGDMLLTPAIFTALLTVYILVRRLRQHLRNKHSKRRLKEIKFVRLSGKTSPTCPLSGRPGLSRNKGKKSSPCILAKLGLDRTKEDGDKAIQEGKAEKKISRTSPSILVRLELDKPPTAVQAGKEEQPRSKGMDKRIQLHGSSSFIRQNPFLWYLPTSERYPPSYDRYPHR